MSTSSVEDSKESCRKRARSEHATAEPDEGRRRGRPRVEKHDESAADRRRTQIRMAQRAYRQRKEGTLDELRKQNSDLCGTVKQMSSIFAALSDNLCKSGLSEAQLHELREYSSRFNTLAESARQQLDGSPPAFDSLPPTARSPSDPPRAVDLPRNVPSWMDQTVAARPPRELIANDVGMGYSMFMTDDQNAVAAIDSPAPVTPNSQYQPSHVGADMFMSQRIQMYDPSATIPPKLPDPPTYSFQESTFGRRLHRACIEGAYRLLCAPAAKPLTYERVFKLSLMSRDRQKLLEIFRHLVRSGPEQDLDAWGAPLLHVGGAGTHYPKIDRFGIAHPRPRAANVGLIGPTTLAVFDSRGGLNMTPEMTVGIAGYEGEWLDPYDVEGYLLEKGIRIDPTSSFTECELVEWPSTSNSVSTISTSNPSTPDSSKWSMDRHPKPLDHEQRHTFEQAGLNLANWNDSTTLSGVGYSDATMGSWLDYVSMSQQIPTMMLPDFDTGGFQFDTPPQTLPYIAQPVKRIVLVDIAKLVKALVHSTVCLGRSCGFRRSDIERALSMASVDPS